MEWILIGIGLYLVWRLLRRLITERPPDLGTTAEIRQKEWIRSKAELDEVMQPIRAKRTKLRRELKKAENLSEKIGLSDSLTAKKAQRIRETLDRTIDAFVTAQTLFTEVNDINDRVMLSEKMEERFYEEVDGFSDLEADLDDAYNSLVNATLHILEMQELIDEDNDSAMSDAGRVYNALQSFLPETGGANGALTTRQIFQDAEDFLATFDRSAPPDTKQAKDVLQLLTILESARDEIDGQNGNTRLIEGGIAPPKPYDPVVFAKRYDDVIEEVASAVRSPLYEAGMIIPSTRHQPYKDQVKQALNIILRDN